MSLPDPSSFVLDGVPEKSRPLDSDDSDLDSLPSISSSILDSDLDSDSSADDLAQEEWERNLEQIQMLLSLVLIPWAGKYFGRKFAYWSWARYSEWLHGVEIRWYPQKKFKAAGIAEAAITI